MIGKAIRKTVSNFSYPPVRNFVRGGVPDKIARAISGHKTRPVFDRCNMVDERDLWDATIRLEHHLAQATVPVWAHSDPTEGSSKGSLSKESNAEKL